MDVETISRSEEEQAVTALEAFLAACQGITLNAMGKVSRVSSTEGPYVEGINRSYRCLWRAYPPPATPTGVGEWRVDIWMLPERSRTKPRSPEADELALLTVASLQSPYRTSTIALKEAGEGAGEQGQQNFDYALWVALDSARAFRNMEGILSGVGGMVDIRVDGYQRTPVDEIVWVQGSIDDSPFTYMQLPGHSPKAVLELKRAGIDVVQRCSVPVSGGWYGDEVLANTFAALLDELADTGDAEQPDE